MKTMKEYIAENGPFYLQVPQAKYFVEKIDLTAISPSIPVSAYQKFAENYILAGDFDTAIAKISMLWFPKELAEFERAMEIFSTESGLTEFVNNHCL